MKNIIDWNAGAGADSAFIEVTNGIVTGVEVGLLRGINEMPLAHDVAHFVSKIRLLSLCNKPYESVKTDSDEEWEDGDEGIVFVNIKDVNIHPYYNSILELNSAAL